MTAWRERQKIPGAAGRAAQQGDKGALQRGQEGGPRDARPHHHHIVLLQCRHGGAGEALDSMYA